MRSLRPLDDLQGRYLENSMAQVPLQSLPNQPLPPGQLGQLSPGSLPAQMAPPAQTDPLANLRDIHIPGALEPWPPALGWWLLAAVAIFLIAFCLLRLFQWWRSKQYRREGIRSLEALLQSHTSEKQYLQDYSELLKRVALTNYPREMVAHLTGEAWVKFLDTSSGTQEFSMGEGQVLIQGNYEPNPSVNIDQLHQLGQHWIKKHKAMDASSQHRESDHVENQHAGIEREKVSEGDREGMSL
jgi:hypothetical protein